MLNIVYLFIKNLTKIIFKNIFLLFETLTFYYKIFTKHCLYLSNCYANYQNQAILQILHFFDA